MKIENNYYFVFGLKYDDREDSFAIHNRYNRYVIKYDVHFRTDI